MGNLAKFVRETKDEYRPYVKSPRVKDSKFGWETDATLFFHYPNIQPELGCLLTLASESGFEMGNFMRAWMRESDPVRQARKAEGTSIRKDYSNTRILPIGSEGKAPAVVKEIQESKVRRIVIVNCPISPTNKNSIIFQIKQLDLPIIIFDRNSEMVIECTAPGIIVVNKPIEKINGFNDEIPTAYITDMKGGKKDTQNLYIPFFKRVLHNNDVGIATVSSSGGFSDTTEDRLAQFKANGFKARFSPYWSKSGFGTKLAIIKLKDF